MACSIASLTLPVREYDEAIAFFTDALRFALIEDNPLGGGKRWVRVFLDLYGNKWDLVHYDTVRAGETA